VMLLLLSGCATSFQGGAHFPGGRGACQHKCGLQGLSMAGLVYMGEYSSACLCEVPSSDKSASLSSGATGGAAVAVMTQMQNAQVATMVSTMLIIGMTTGVGLGAGG
ncbi:MAG TPA: hypothetical protein VFN67_41385, partial [Polyangiales bacterium]|nr:hypothetical protein [Polyangiales bacterium]